MAVFRILGAGLRRKTGTGHIRALGAPGPASAPVAAASAGTAFSLNAAISAASIVTVAAAPGVAAFSASALPRAFAHLGTAPAPLAFSLGATALGSLALPPAHAITAFSLAPARISSSLITALPAVSLPFGFTATAGVSTNTGQQWSNLWQSVYAARQTVLNAIDANNRFLAKQAGSTAQAAADALVVTNTRVDTIDDTVTAEAERTTALTARMSNAEGNINTLGTSLFTLGSRVTATESDLAVKSWQLQSVQSSLGGKANASAVSALQTEVNQLGQAKAQWTLSLNSNGHISGIHAINNGVQSQFNIAASVFRVLAPNGAQNGMEIRDGTVRVWRGNSQRIIGNGFGQGSELMDYFGPNVGTQNASKQNAVIWMDTNGNAEFKGIINAEKITGTFQVATEVNWNGSIDLIANKSNWKRWQPKVWFEPITTFTLPTPMRAGEAHRPLFQLFVTLSNQAYGVQLQLERLINGAWQPYHQRNNTYGITYMTLEHRIFSLVGENVAALTHIGPPTQQAEQFRISARCFEAALNLDSGQPQASIDTRVISVTGRVVGIR